jgi:8-oxo-dGTP diphosphatase
MGSVIDPTKQTALSRHVGASWRPFKHRGLIGSVLLREREVREENGLTIPLPLFKQVQTYEDFEDPRGKYVCLLYVLSEPLSPEASIEAGDDASHVHAVENMQSLPDLAYSHIRLLRMALRQLFTSYYHNAVGMHEIDACQCEVERFPGQHCSNPAYWRYNGIAICPRHIQSVVRKQVSKPVL